MLGTVVGVLVLLLLGALRAWELRAERRARARRFKMAVAGAMVTPAPLRKLRGRGL